MRMHHLTHCRGASPNALQRHCLTPRGDLLWPLTDPGPGRKRAIQGRWHCHCWEAHATAARAWPLQANSRPAAIDRVGISICDRQSVGLVLEGLHCVANDRDQAEFKQECWCWRLANSESLKAGDVLKSAFGDPDAVIDQAPATAVHHFWLS